MPEPERTERARESDNFLRNFQPHVAWLLLAVGVLVVIGLLVAFSPWVNTEDTTEPPPPPPNIEAAP